MVLTSRNEKQGLNAAVAVPLGKQGLVDAVEVLQGNQGLMDAVVMVRRHGSITTTTALEPALLFPGSVVWSGSTGMATTNWYCTPQKNPGEASLSSLLHRRTPPPLSRLPQR